jgi:hydrogenase/urease accessory protein HupE
MLWAVLAAAPRPAMAHEFRPAVLSLLELEPGVFQVQWQPPRDASRLDRAALRPVFPEGCTLDRALLRCDERGLAGALHIAGMETTQADVIVVVTRADGRARTTVLRGADAAFTFARDPSALEVAALYTALGIEHILLGFDHLAFVLGLVLLVDGTRRLVETITAFTVAHSITLAASVLGWVRLASGPVELIIALSILLLAVELADGGDSLTRRRPAVVAFVFGLLHGFGFAGALRDVGLPEVHLGLALATFNVGVELGQLAVVGGILAVMGAAMMSVRSHDRAAMGSSARDAQAPPASASSDPATGSETRLRARVARLRAMVVLALGAAGAAWSLDRALGLF